MLQVKFYDHVDDNLLKYAVIIARTGNKWVFCKHKDRNTYEIPGGHREAGEAILDAARRELYEETGALHFELKPICVYSVIQFDSEDIVSPAPESYGMLYYAEITAFEGELHHEIDSILITDRLVKSWTYPAIQPRLLEEAKRRGYVDFKEEIMTDG